jgi:2-polyprenyl-3-methyl-5-hydroxy-6-metoxy-1,4-benzoquinol methylase
MFKRANRYIKKLLSGGHPVKIKYSKDDWDAQYKKGNWNFLLKRHENIVQVTQILKDLAVPKEKISVLDVGCGNGALARELDSNQFFYTGLDISSEALEQAKITAPHGRYIQSSMDSTPPLAETFDVLIFCEVLLYGDYERTLKIYKPYLKPDGFIIISLYDVWRTKLIWRSLKKQIKIINLVYIKNLTRKVGWTVCLGRYSSESNNRL